MKRSKFAQVAVVLALVLTMFATTQIDPALAAKLDKYILPGNAVYPEGIDFQERTDKFFVSSTTDGSIFRGDIKEDTASVYLPGGQDGRTTAVGLKVDDNRLFIAGGSSGKVFVYNVENKQLLASFSNGKAANATFINDVIVTKDGDAFFTDSVAPVLYRVYKQGGEYKFEEWLNFTGTPLVYQSGFNLNGIAASKNGKYLVVVQSNTGKLFRIEIANKQVSPIDLGGATVTNGDGILLDGRKLYVLRNQNELLVKVELDKDLLTGAVVSSTNYESFQFPTTLAEAKGRFLVVNSQFDKQATGNPEIPFNVVSVKKP